MSDTGTFTGRAAEEIANLVVAELFSLLDLTAAFPVWQPVVEVVVQPNGQALVTLGGEFNLFLTVRRIA